MFFIYDNASAHRNANNPGANSELKPLPAHSPFPNIVEQAISCLKGMEIPVLWFGLTHSVLGTPVNSTG